MNGFEMNPSHKDFMVSIWEVEAADAKQIVLGGHAQPMFTINADIKDVFSVCDENRKILPADTPLETLNITAGKILGNILNGIRELELRKAMKSKKS